MTTLKEYTKEAQAFVAEWRNAIVSASDAQRKTGKVILAVERNLKGYFKFEEASKRKEAFVAWYTKLGLDKSEVSWCKSRSQASTLLGVKVERTLNTAHIAKLAPVMNERASGSTKLLPKAERKENTLKVLAEAQRVADDEEREFSGTDIVNARNKLGLKAAKERTPKERAQAQADAVTNAMGKVSEAAMALFSQEQLDTMATFHNNAAIASGLRIAEAEEARLAAEAEAEEYEAELQAEEDAEAEEAEVA